MLPDVKPAAMLVIAVCALASSCHADSAVELSNKFIKLAVRGASIVRMQVDPQGKAPKSISFVKDLRPEFWWETPETRVEVSGTRAVISPLEVWEYRPIVTPGRTNEPSLLMPGHTIAQTFKVVAGEKFDWLQVYLPTWGRKTSSATLTLYRDAEIICSRRLKGVPDNSWQSLNLETPQGEGTYTIVLSNPSGMIGWWSTSSDTTPNGEGLRDGQPASCDRAIQVHVRRQMGTGKLVLSLDRNKLNVEAEFHPQSETAYKSFPWRWRTTWTKAGYDCTPKSGTVFSRFFTDNQRYMPVQQLKRRDHGGLAFDGCQWIEMDGTRDADLRLESGDMHLHWELRPEEMHLRFDTPLDREGDVIRTRFTLAVLPRDDSVPSQFPRFGCSDKALEGDLNRFWWERGFTYPSPANRASEWFEWMALIRAWHERPKPDPEIANMADHPITDEGYVWTSRESIGWPLVPNRDTRHFDTNARYILGVWRYWLWTGDMDFLRGQAERLRSAMNYQLEVLKGKDGLIVTPDFRTGRHEDLSDNYWDILPFGHLDAYANAVFHGSLLAMAQIEEALTSAAVHSSLITHQPGYYRELSHRSHRSYDDTFWLEDKGRYAGCVDIDGVKHDYGFTFVNLEALYYGLGDAEKARRIYKWMETEPTSTGKADTYSKWIFAPRASTIHNPPWKSVNSGRPESRGTAPERLGEQSTVNGPAPQHPTP